MRLLDSISLGFHERMHGRYEGVTLDVPVSGAFAFDVDVACKDLSHPLKMVRADMSGTVSMHGIGEDMPMSGTVLISPFWRRSLTYDFDFQGPDGKDYHFRGEKQIRWRHALDTWTRLPGKVYEQTSRLAIADVVAYFDLHRDLLRMLTSVHRLPT